MGINMDYKPVLHININIILNKVRVVYHKVLINVAEGLNNIQS